jgi:hypothetical protein
VTPAIAPATKFAQNGKAGSIYGRYKYRYVVIRSKSEFKPVQMSIYGVCASVNVRRATENVALHSILDVRFLSFGANPGFVVIVVI